MRHPLDNRRQPMSYFEARRRLDRIRDAIRLRIQALTMHEARVDVGRMDNKDIATRREALLLDLDALDTCESALEAAETAAVDRQRAYDRGYASGERSGASRVTNAQRGQDMGG